MLGIRPVNTTVSAGAVKVADWNDGKPLIVYKDNVGPMNAHRVDLGFFPVSNDSQPDHGSRHQMVRKSWQMHSSMLQ